MINYYQPDFYHFSEDSVLLAKFVAKRLGTEDRSILDLCAGCGVVGIELSRILGHKHQLQFIEKQIVFKEILEKNCLNFLESNYEILIQSFQELSGNEEIDVLVCNPPYFLEEESRKPSNVQTARCRLINIKLATNFVELLSKFKKNGAKVFVVSRKEGIGKLLSVELESTQIGDDLYVFS